MPYHDATTPFQHGLACLRAQQYAAALVAFTHAIEIDPLFVPAWIERGFLLLSNDDDQAARDFDRAIEIDPACGPAYRGRGWVRYGARDFEAALRDAYHGIECDLGDPAPYELLIGAAYRALEDYPQAIAAYTRIVERDPQHAEAYYHRAQAHLESDSQSTALADLNQTLLLHPGWLPALQMRSVLYLHIDQPKLALADLNTILEQYPDVAAAYYWRSQAYARLHRLRLSYLDFVQAGLLNPNLRENHTARWIFAYIHRFLLSVMAAIAFGLFALLFFAPPDLSPQSQIAITGTFGALEPREGSDLTITLTGNAQHFVIESGDFAFFNLQGFTHDVRPGDPLTLSVPRRAYEDRRRFSDLVILQVYAAGRSYIDSDRLIESRRREANTLFPLGMAVALGIAVLAILPAIRSPWPRSSGRAA